MGYRFIRGRANKEIKLKCSSSCSMVTVLTRTECLMPWTSLKVSWRREPRHAWLSMPGQSSSVWDNHAWPVQLCVILRILRRNFGILLDLALEGQDVNWDAARRKDIRATACEANLSTSNGGLLRRGNKNSDCVAEAEWHCDEPTWSQYS